MDEKAKLERALEDPADDPEAAATVEELIAAGKADFDALRDVLGRYRDGDVDGTAAIPEAVEHMGGLIETVGREAPRLSEQGRREELVTGILRTAGADGPIAELLVALGKVLVGAWRKRRDRSE